ncbi:unnamed protein product [Rotaria socialis]|uniref:Uncharacterized protein n=1 Tax=Rotaria socialis TaxID=392032 RepID=A0A818D0J3_9BILA|nr:unnamed protein product [Rotaria socialis]CAF4665702.1 unnamed protein product [Rotaria socialis]
MHLPYLLLGHLQSARVLVWALIKRNPHPYHKHNANNPQRHWTLPGGVESAVTNPEKNDCLFNVVAQQTGKVSNQLRESISTRLENNKENLANQAFDIKRLEQYKQDWLNMGGRKVQTDNPTSELRERKNAKVPSRDRELIFNVLSKLENDQKYIEVGLDSNDTKTVFETENLRFDNEEPTQENHDENWQIQLGGMKFYSRKLGEYTTISHVLLKKPTNPNDTYLYLKRKVSGAFNTSLNTGKTVILRPPTSKLNKTKNTIDF